MGDLAKIAFKPELSSEEQVRQRILVESWIGSREPMSRYDRKVAHFPLDWTLSRFVEWFPKIVQSEFTHWRRENLDTRDSRAGTNWRCFPVSNGEHRGEIWLSFPQGVRMSKSDKPNEDSTFIMLGEQWSQDHLRGKALGPAIWLTVTAKPSGIQGQLGCEDLMCGQPAIESYFDVIKEMLITGTFDADSDSRARQPIAKPTASLLSDSGFVDSRIFTSRPDVMIVKDTNAHAFKDWLCNTLEMWASPHSKQTLFVIKSKERHSAWVIEVFNRATLPRSPEDIGEFGFISDSCMEFRVSAHGPNDVNWVGHCFWDGYRDTFYKSVHEIAWAQWSIVPVESGLAIPQANRGGRPVSGDRSPELRARDQMIRKLYSQKVPVPQIAERVGRSRSLVYMVLREKEAKEV